MRIFLDANVLFSAAKTEGAVRQLLATLAERRHELWVDRYVLEEARRNLAVKAPAALGALDEILATVRVAPLAEAASELGTQFSLPEKDRPVLAAAIRLECAVLITGDRTHFGRFYGKAISGVEVLAPAAAAKPLLAREIPVASRFRATRAPHRIPQ